MKVGKGQLALCRRSHSHRGVAIAADATTWVMKRRAGSTPTMTVAAPSLKKVGIMATT